MGLFGKKKTTEEILAKGRAEFYNNDLKHAFLTMHGLANKGEPEACYYIGVYWLKRGDRKMAEKYLRIAAEGGRTEAVKTLAEQMGIQDYLSARPTPVSVPTPSPAPKPEPVPTPPPAPKPEPVPTPPPAPKPEPEPTPEPAPVPKSAPAPTPAPQPEMARVDTYFDLAVKAHQIGEYDAALKFFKQAGEMGSGTALYNVGVMYEQGMGVEKDLKEALSWYEKAAFAGYDKAVKAVENTKRNIGAEEMAEKMKADMEESRRKKEAIAAADGGDDYLKGEELKKAKDYDGAVAAWTKAADQGHKEALKKLANFYAGDISVWGLRAKDIRQNYIDYDKAIEWGTLAMNQGVDVADCIMDAYKGKGMTEEALAFGEKAADQGWNTEWRLMYLCLELERYEEATAWGARYDLKKGGTEAQKRLEQMQDDAFEKALTAYKEENYAESLPLWKKAAGLGSSSAMFNCGLMYEKGQGAEANMEEAVLWYEKAAAQGEEKAKVMLEEWKKAKELAELTGRPERTADYHKNSEAAEEDALKQGRSFFFQGEYQKAAKLLSFAAYAGYWDACFLLGRMYAEGLGVKRDSKKAGELYDQLQAKPIGERYGITFGTYPQGARGEKKPISWTVLDRKGDQLLLLSNQILDVKPYHGECTDMTWENCDLRRWLNGEFLRKAFSGPERDMLIAKTRLQNPDNADYHIRGGNPTEDQIFLLSIQEAQKYFIKEIPERKDYGKESGNAKVNGAYFYDTEERLAAGFATDYAKNQRTKGDSDKGMLQWWLRSPGMLSPVAASVTAYGSIYVGGLTVDYNDVGVRPALWLKLKS